MRKKNYSIHVKLHRLRDQVKGLKKDALEREARMEASQRKHEKLMEKCKATMGVEIAPGGLGAKNTRGEKASTASSPPLTARARLPNGPPQSKGVHKSPPITGSASASTLPTMTTQEEKKRNGAQTLINDYDKANGDNAKARGVREGQRETVSIASEGRSPANAETIRDAGRINEDGEHRHPKEQQMQEEAQGSGREQEVAASSQDPLAPILKEVENKQANDVDQDNEIYEFCVNHMSGNGFIHKARSIQELRVRVAIQEGTLCPRILLFRYKGGNYDQLEDAQEISTVFQGVATMPYKLDAVRINKKFFTKNDATWSTEEWISVLAAHRRYGDENLAKYVKPLMVDENVNLKRKLKKWLSALHMDLRNNFSAHSLDDLAERIKMLTSLLSREYVESLHRATRGLVQLAAGFGHTGLLRVLLEGGWSPVETLHYLKSQDLLGYRGIKYPLGSEVINCIPNSDLNPPISRAVFHGHHDAVKLLAKAKATVNERIDGQTLLYIASGRGDVDMIKILLRHGANVNARTIIMGPTKAFRLTAYDFAKNEESRDVLRICGGRSSLVLDQIRGQFCRRHYGFESSR